MKVVNNYGGWDIIEDDAEEHCESANYYFNPNDYCDLTELYIDTVSAFLAFKDVLSEIDLQRLTKPEQIQLYNLLNLDT